MNKYLVPSKREFREHLEKYASFVNPPEIIDWCADVSPYRTKRVVLSLLNYKDSSARVLDLGCGTGLNTVSIASAFPKTVAVDVDPNCVTATKDFLSIFKVKIPVLCYDGKILPFPRGSFDIVNCVEVFEHAKNPNLLLKEIKRVLAPDGILYITAPNVLWPIEGHYHLPFLSYLPRRLANYYVRLMGKGEGYENIYLLPTYEQFYRMVSKYFNVQDLTFATVMNYKKYEVDKERGANVKYVSKILRYVDDARKVPIIGRLADLANLLLLNISVGWLFLARPRVN